MRGSRPLSDEEIEKIGAYFSRYIGDEVEDRYDYLTRDKCLILLTIYTGFRIAEVLSLKLGDIMNGKTVSNYVYLQKNNTKGKKRGRSGIINENCKVILQEYLNHYSFWNLDKEKKLFFSKKGDLKTRQALNIFKSVFEKCNMDGKLSTHTARKTFSRLVYRSLGEDILGLKSALGHTSINSTMNYIEENKEKLEAVLKNLKL